MSDLLFFLEKIHWPYPQGKQIMNSPAPSRASVLAAGRWQARVRRWTFALSVFGFFIPKGDDLEAEQNSTLWLLIRLFVLQHIYWTHFIRQTEIGPDPKLPHFWSKYFSLHGKSWKISWNKRSHCPACVSRTHSETLTLQMEPWFILCTLERPDVSGSDRKMAGIILIASTSIGTGATLIGVLYKVTKISKRTEFLQESLKDKLPF